MTQTAWRADWCGYEVLREALPVEALSAWVAAVAVGGFWTLRS